MRRLARGQGCQAGRCQTTEWQGCGVRQGGQIGKRSLTRRASLPSCALAAIIVSCEALRSASRIGDIASAVHTRFLIEMVVRLQNKNASACVSPQLSKFGGQEDLRLWTLALFASASWLPDPISTTRQSTCRQTRRIHESGSPPGRKAKQDLLDRAWPMLCPPRSWRMRR